MNSMLGKQMAQNFGSGAETHNSRAVEKQDHEYLAKSKNPKSQAVSFSYTKDLHPLKDNDKYKSNDADDRQNIRDSCYNIIKSLVNKTVSAKHKKISKKERRKRGCPMKLRWFTIPKFRPRSTMKFDCLAKVINKTGLDLMSLPFKTFITLSHYYDLQDQNLLYYDKLAIQRINLEMKRLIANRDRISKQTTVYRRPARIRNIDFENQDWEFFHIAIKWLVFTAIMLLFFIIYPNNTIEEIQILLNLKTRVPETFYGSVLQIFSPNLL